jgi:glutaredoxin 3
MYSTASCPYCRAADSLLERKGVSDIERVRVDLEPGRRAEMQQKSGRTTVPQIWIDGRHVGGSDELHGLDASGQLDKLLAKAT